MKNEHFHEKFKDIISSNSETKVYSWFSTDKSQRISEVDLEFYHFVTIQRIFLSEDSVYFMILRRTFNVISMHKGKEESVNFVSINYGKILPSNCESKSWKKVTECLPTL